MQGSAQETTVHPIFHGRVHSPFYGAAVLSVLRFSLGVLNLVLFEVGNEGSLMLVEDEFS